MEKKIPVWQLLERRQTNGETPGGQIAFAELVGYDWFPISEEPPLYEPDENGMVWCVPSSSEVPNPYHAAPEKPPVPKELINRIAALRQNSTGCSEFLAESAKYLGT